MYHTAIVTPWVGSGTAADPFRPLVAEVFAVAWSDLTGQPSADLRPSPNAYTVRVVAPLATIQAIAADSRFVVLWAEEVVDAAP
jgi:hypothetical protein